MASLAEASVAGFQPEPVSSRVWACPQPRRLTRGSAHPGTAPMVRPLTALRDPSLLLPALLSAAARPLTSLSVLRATPPRAQRADPAAAETPRRPDAAPAHPPAPLPARLARSLALYSFSHCLPCQNTTLVTCPNNSQPILVTSSAEAARAGCYGNASRAPWSWRLGTGLPGQGSQRIRGPAGAACTARLSSHGTALRVHWGHLGDVNLGLTLDGKIIIVSTPPQGCWPGAKELGIQP